MRILHVASEYPPAKVYGLGRFVHGLARAQAELGNEVMVLTNSTGGAEDAVELEGVHVHRIEFPNPPRPADGHGEVLQFNHCLVARYLDRRATFARAELVASHDWLTAIAAREIARDLGVPLVATFHDEVIGKHFGVLDADGRFVRDLEALNAHDATRIIANSRFIADQIVQHYGVPTERVHAIHGGIDPSLLEVAAPACLAHFRSVLASEDEVLVAYLGRLDPEKGLGTLAEAALIAGRERPELRFAIAGSGREEGRLTVRLAPLGSRAKFLGYVKRELLAHVYRAADVVVVPSLYEPFGLVALEALSAGAAVVTSAAGGLREIVRDGEDGLLYPPGDAAALADAIARLAADPALRAALKARGQERARRDFSWAGVAKATQQVYLDAVREPRPLCETPPREPKPPLVSVTVATHEAPAHLETALRSLFQRTDFASLEAVVVDNASSPEARDRLEHLVQELRGRGHAITHVRNEENRRFSAAQNQAIALAGGEYVCLLNDDTEIPAGSEEWLKGLVWALENLGAGTVTPVTTFRDGRIYWAGSSPTGTHAHFDEPDRKEIVPAPERTIWNNMACLLTRRRYFDPEEVGPLREDADHAQYGSDREWCLRLSEKLGLGHWVHPARILHHSAESPRKALPAFQWNKESRLPASIVLVLKDALPYTREAVASVLANTRPPYELVFVDNGSAADTRAYLADLRDRVSGGIAVQILRNEENLGFPRAANQGLRAARGRSVVVLNNDALVRPGWLEALLAASRSRARVGIVTAKILNLDGTVQNAGGILHHPDGSFTIPNASEDRLAPTVTQRRVVENAGGPCMLFTRELLEQVGVFDEAFSPAYFEDSDLSLRARDAGFLLLYEPRSEVLHHAKATTNAVVREGKLDVWGRFEANKRLFHERWRDRLEADEAARISATPPRRRIVLCYGRDPTTTAAYCEAALRREHDVVTAGPGQEIDLGDDATASEVVRAAGGADLLVAIEGRNYFPREITHAPCPTAWWAIDAHIHARPEEEGYFALAREFDHVFLAQRDHAGAFSGRGIETTWLPLACDPDIHRGSDVPRDLDVVFVGHVLPIHRRRRALLDRLKRRFRVHEARVFREDMARLYSRARVVWNCSLAGDLNMRVFEALASGSLLVTDRIANGLETFFADGEHLQLYDDETLEIVVAQALAEPDRAQEIGARGQRLVLRHHTYGHRMRELVRVATSAPRVARKETVA